MTVQTRIMLFIVGSGFLASLLFSLVVFYEMVEQPFNLLDAVLREEGTRVVRSLAQRPGSTAMPTGNRQDLGVDQYWLEVRVGGDNQLLFRSPLAEAIRIAPLPPGAVAILHPQKVDRASLLPWQKNNQPVLRMLAFSLDMAGRTFWVQIGRPMEQLQEEIQELIFGLLAGLIFSTLVLSALSRSVANKILQPVQEIKDLARDISEQNLSRRIPLRDPGDEINELAETINLMLDRLQHSFDRQRGFLYATSHELKTPLATIRLAVDELFARESESATVPFREDLLRIARQSLRLERLVKDLLTLSSLETVTGLVWKPVDLSALLCSLVEDFRELAEAQGVSFKCDIAANCLVQGESEKLQRAVVNILDNALKFNREAGQVEVSCLLEDDWVVLAVSNTGFGVTAAELAQVFDPFYRGEKSRALEFGGFGLGLAIVEKTVTLHQGQISYACDADMVTMTLRLPRC